MNATRCSHLCPDSSMKSQTGHSMQRRTPLDMLGNEFRKTVLSHH